MNSQIDIQHIDTPNLRLPAANVFERRSDRLRALATGHAMQEFLLFCADLALVQQSCLEELSDQIVSDMAGLRRILTLLQTQLGPRMSMACYSSLTCLLAEDDDTLQSQAEDLRHGHYRQHVATAAALPLLGAALQVQTIIATRQRDLRHISEGQSDACPVCDAPPVASVLRRGESGHAVRYACCAMCASEWHVSRVKCLACGNSRNLQYRSMVPAATEFSQPTHKQPHQNRAVQEVECCDECQGSLKMISPLQDSQAEAFADDLSSLMLDMLAGEAGYGRIGFNPYFLPGQD